MPVEDGQPTQLTHDKATDHYPVWSPDESKIAFTSNRSGNMDIWIIPAAGGEARQLTFHESHDDQACWSPDGTQIAFMSKRSGKQDIWITFVSGGDPARFTETSDNSWPTWSPDGTKIAFISMRDSHYEIYIMNADGSNQTRVTTTNGHAIDPDWKPITNPTSVKESGQSFNLLHKNFQLFQNYPNPLNSEINDFLKMNALARR